jgi:hypothetical protein
MDNLSILSLILMFCPASAIILLVCMILIYKAEKLQNMNINDKRAFSQIEI